MNFTLTFRPSIEDIKEHIKKSFSTKEFTIGELYYHFNSNWDKSVFGTIRNVTVKLTKQGFLDFRMVPRGSTTQPSPRAKKGALYKLKAN